MVQQKFCINDTFWGYASKETRNSLLKIFVFQEFLYVWFLWNKKTFDYGPS